MDLKASRQLLTISFLLLNVFALTHAYAIRYEACSGVNNGCACSFGHEFEVGCPGGSQPKITLKVENQQAVINCNLSSDRKIYTLLPDLELTNMSSDNIERVKFENCPLPEGTTLKGIIVDKLGITNVRMLTFSSRYRDVQMRREYLSGLNSLWNLRIMGKISDYPEDTFNDVSNITALELHSNNVHLPLNIFKNLHELLSLELGSNNLSHLAPGIFSNQHNLKQLNLWSNNLRNLTKDSFLGASSVTQLDLSNNNIEVLQPNVFEHLRDLENINLMTNRFTELPAGLFSQNKKLSKFKLINNRVDLKKLPSGLLADLPHLNDVIISCNIESLPDDLFNRSNNIQSIQLQSNKLATLPVNLFDSQINLTHLDLSDNQLIELPDNLFSNAKKLQKIILSKNNLREISEKLFAGLTQLNELYLDDNRLHTIHRDAFRRTNLLKLHLENNRLDFLNHITNTMLKDIAKYSPFEHTNKLTHLYLRNNSIKQFLDGFRLHNLDLQELDLSHNQISSIELKQIATIWKQPVTVNLSHNHIKSITSDRVDYFITVNETLQNAQPIFDSHPNILWKWILNGNPINCDCSIFFFVKFLRENSALERYLKLMVDDLRCSTPAKLQNQLVKNVALDDLLCPLDDPETKTKYCPSKCNCWVRVSDETAIFDCSNAHLDRVPTLPSSRLDSISWLKNYELNIENNNITALPIYNEPGYELVTKINARNNQIGKELFNKNLPRNLKTLDLSQNKLEKLDIQVLMRLNNSGTIRSLKLAGNKWDCGCKTEFVKYIRANSNKVDYNNITCSDNTSISTQTETCPYEKAVIIAICVLIALLGLFIGTVIALYYKYQTEVKVWLFAHKLCLWWVTEEEVDKDKKYDAFISFSHKDEDFVTEHLVPELENGSNPFKLCLHFRDFVVGEFIPNQISKSVEDSRRTVVVLSPNFIDSIWGRMEFRAAHQKSIAEGRARLIVIIYGDIGDIEKLDPELRVYLKTNTYLKWGDPWFFDKLRYALPHPTNYKSKGLIKSTMKSSIDDKLELIKPQAVTPPLTTPPAEQAGHNPLIGKLNGDNAKYHSGLNGLNGHVNGAFIINTNAKQSDV